MVGLADKRVNAAQTHRTNRTRRGRQKRFSSASNPAPATNRKRRNPSVGCGGFVFGARLVFGLCGRRLRLALVGGRCGWGAD